MVHDDWADVAANHAVWGRTSTDEQRDDAVALVRGLAQVREAARPVDDPWQDASFAVRIARRLEDLLPSGLRLSGDEATLLVVAPFLYDTLWAGLAAAERVVGPADLSPSQDASSDRAAFERFAQTYAQPYRRAVAAARAGRAERAEIGRHIGWWLLHRWIGRRPEAYQPASIGHLIGAAAKPAELVRLAELLRTMRADPGFLSRVDRPGALAAVGADGVREQLLGFLLAAARGMAIEATALPEVIGEHLGIADPVTPAAVLATVRAAGWQARGATMVLAAACAHPSIEVALLTHVDTLNQLLAEAHRAGAGHEALRPLLELPTRIAADDVGPAVVDGAPAYRSAGVRFRLAEDRVQELLMGEQLYGDPALAIRELYQNALDACRYREARTEYLRRAHDLAGDWQGRIRFVQGVDDEGRGYLDCVDNGIGMGVRELSEVFSQAGVRLADLPEFLEEQAEWARLDPPVQLFPNSRFGIGVLSYFMLADEITVETCRMRRDGRPGERLRVSIAGPGSLFRIQTIATGPDGVDGAEEAGTTVRLHLRDGVSVSSVEKLREVLWVAEFRTDAEDGVTHQTWLPGELAEGARERDDDDRSGAIATEGHRVWWCRGEGALLADGLYAGRDLFGAVVNLSRDLAPRLSVDRTKILAYREEDVDRLLWEATPALTAGDTTILDFDWLYSMAQVRPLIADLVFERALENGHGTWKMGDETVDAAIAGCFSANDGVVNGPEELVEWRLTALAAGGRFRKVLKPAPEWRRALRARPSDALLLSLDVDGASPWLDPVDIVPLVHLVRAARRIGRGAIEAADRLEAMGYTVSVGAAGVGSDPDDLIMTSRDVDGARPWLDPAEPVRLVHLLRTVHRTGRSPRQVVARLRALGFTVDLDVEALPMDGFGAKDVVLASRDLDGAGPWLDPAEPVTLVQLLRAAHKVNLTVAETAQRLALLGHHFEPGWQTVRTEPDDLVLLSRDLDSTSPWLDPAEAVSPVHLLRAAERTGRPVGEVVERLRSIGFTVLLDAAIDQVKLEPDDLTMASRDLDGSQPWLDPTRPVPLIHLLRAADVTGRELRDVMARLAACGYRVDLDPDAVLIDHLEPDDLTLASEDNDGSDPWLDPAKPVPLVRILRAAQRTRRDVHDVAARLAFLGYSVTLGGGHVPLNDVEPDDMIITSRDLDGSHPWLDLDETVPLPHLLQAARRVRKPVHEIAARLERLGYTVEVDLAAVAVDAVKPSDLVLASADLDGSRPWLDSGQPVPLSHVVNAAQKVRKSVEEVTDRLRLLGYPVYDLDTRLPRLRPGGV